MTFIAFILGSFIIYATVIYIAYRVCEPKDIRTDHKFTVMSKQDIDNNRSSAYEYININQL